MSSSKSFYISGSYGTAFITYTTLDMYNNTVVVHDSNYSSMVQIVYENARSTAVILFVFDGIGTGYSPYGARDYNRYNIGFKLYRPTTISNSKYESSADDMKVAYILF